MRSWLAAAAVGVLVLGEGGRAARADDVEQAARKLGDLEARIRSLVSEFKEAPAPSAETAERRVIDARVLMELKNFDQAAIMLLDVTEKFGGTRAGAEAVYLLGECLFQMRDFYSARAAFEKATENVTGTKQQQQALQRLIEIALRTGDFEGVPAVLAKLDRVPLQTLEPSVPYVRAKYLYFTDKADDAAPIFNSIPPSSPYFFQARYFLATALVRKGDLAGASVAYDAILKQQAPDDSAREIQDLARLALGRILYDRSQFDRAVDQYRQIQRQSRLFADALYESAWTYIKQRDFQKAYRAFDLLLLTNPDSPQAPELKILMGNLHLRLANYYLASDAFSKSREEFEPVHKQLQDAIVRAQSDPGFFQNLVGKNLEKFDIGVFIPPAAVKWVRADPEVGRMLTLTGDVASIERALKESNQIMARLERAVASSGKVGLFPDLSRARAGSVEVLDDLIAVRSRLGRRVRQIEGGALGNDESSQLDRLAGERDRLEQEVQSSAHGDKKKQKEAPGGEFGKLDGEASELNVDIQSLKAQVVALRHYYRASRKEQALAQQDLDNQTRDLDRDIDELQAMHDKIREDIGEAARDLMVERNASEGEIQAARRLGELARREQEIQTRAMGRLPSNEQAQVSRILEVLGRADAVERGLFEFDKRIEGQAEQRLAAIRETMATEKQNLEQEGQKLASVMTESQTLGGGLAQVMFTKVADRFYDLVVRSDVGLIDVAWGLKDAKTSVLSKLVAQQKAESKAAEEDFRRVIEDLKQ